MAIRSKEMAGKLDGREYGEEITKEEEQLAKENKLVVAFGASDDLMIFKGAIDDEISCYGVEKAYIDNGKVLENECLDHECPYFEETKEQAKRITASYEGDNNENGYAWQYQTDIPHETFDVLFEGKPYCKGIVFSLDDL